VKAFSTERIEYERFVAKNLEVYEYGQKSAVWAGLIQFVFMICFNSAMAGIIYYSSFLAKEGKITVGGISAFLLYMI
jgi:ABC-type multidrug transport system fused ATPase/permease subunit